MLVVFQGLMTSCILPNFELLDNYSIGFPFLLASQDERCQRIDDHILH